MSNKKKLLPANDKPEREAPPNEMQAFWDTNAHSISMMYSLLRGATPGEQFALKRVLRILHAISDETNPER